ncbi:hypothetical protein [Desulfovibrio falkowii]|uniref:hypothetical protein n=1 Tax=Desulfovibrio sp. WGS1351 TaxID=3366814 RepID=UPI00372CFC5B
MEKQNEQSLTLVMTEDELASRLKEERLKTTEKVFDIALQPVLRFANILSEYNLEANEDTPVLAFEIGDMLRLMALGGYAESLIRTNPDNERHSYINSDEFRKALQHSHVLK